LNDPPWATGCGYADRRAYVDNGLGRWGQNRWKQSAAIRSTDHWARDRIGYHVDWSGRNL
jgi:hypothetical protein